MFYLHCSGLTVAFGQVEIRNVLTHGNLVESDEGQRHEGGLLSLAREIWPRRLMRRLLPNAGLAVLIEVTK